MTEVKSEGEFKKRIQELVDKSGWLQYANAGRDFLLLLDDAKKELTFDLKAIINTHKTAVTPEIAKLIEDFVKWFGAET